MVLKNVMLEWIHVTQPVYKFGSETDKEFVVSAVVDKAVAQQWIDDGLGKVLKPHKTIKDKFIIKIATNQYKKDGSAMAVPKLVDSFGKPIEGLVGNGSIGSIAYRTFKWKNPKFGEGEKAILVAVKVDELIAYGDNAIDEFDFVDESVLGMDDDVLDFD